MEKHYGEHCGGSLKVKIELPYDPEVPLLGKYLEKMKTLNLKRYVHPNIHSSTIHNNQVMESTEMAVDRGMYKEDVVHIYNRILLIHKKE